jgi:phosphatidate phosphatase APP1
MTDVNITVAAGTPFNVDSTNSVLSIIVTNTADVPCATGTNAYYYIVLSDGTNEEKYTFIVTAPGTIPAATAQTFVVENTTLGTIQDSDGTIYYSAA